MKMVEKAARALWEKQSCEPVTAKSWGELNDIIKENLRDDVRAVLAAIREPNKTILDAYGDDMVEIWRGMIDLALDK